MSASESMERAFVDASLAQQATNAGIAELSAVLNHLPKEFFQGTDTSCVDAVDELIDRLYRRGSLSFPGHRWLLGDPPASVRGQVLSLFEAGHIHRDPAGHWTWRVHTTYFAVKIDE